MKAGRMPTTQPDGDRAEAAHRLVNQGHRAVQLALQVQPMSHLPLPMRFLGH
jgi:hypothetical protein